MGDITKPVGNFGPSALDTDDGSAEDPNKNLVTTKMAFIDPAHVDPLISAMVAEGQSQGVPAQALTQFATIAKIILPALGNVVAPGVGTVVSNLLSVVPQVSASLNQ